MRRSYLTFGYVEEDIWDLEDIVEVFLVAISPFEDFVFVAGYLEALLAYRNSQSCGFWAKVGGVVGPFFIRTRETFVSLIWLDGWFMGIGIVTICYGNIYFGKKVCKSVVVENL